MIYPIAFLLIFLPLLWGSLRGFAMHWLLWQMAICTALIAFGSIVYTYLQTQGLQMSSDGRQHNYFVVPELSWILGGTLIVIPLGGILWAQSRWANALWPILQKTAIWCIAAGLLVPLLGYAAFDLGALPQPELLQIVEYGRTLNTTALIAALIGSVCLLVLPLTSLIFRRS